MLNLTQNFCSIQNGCSDRNTLKIVRTDLLCDFSLTVHTCLNSTLRDVWRSQALQISQLFVPRTSTEETAIFFLLRQLIYEDIRWSFKKYVV